jgi:hypothetical protein
MWSRSASGQKRQHEESPSSMGASTLVASSMSFSQSDCKRWKSATSLPPSMQQMMLIGTKHDPHATERMDIAIAHLMFSNGLPISLVECTKFNKLIQLQGTFLQNILLLTGKNGRTVAGQYLSIDI